MSLTIQYLAEHGVTIQGGIDPHGMKYFLVAVVLLGIAASLKRK